MAEKNNNKEVPERAAESSPVVRIVLPALILIAAAALLAAAVYLLSFLLLIVVLSIFVAYLLEPLVRFIRKPFKVRNLEYLMPRGLAILISYLLVFTAIGFAAANLAPLIAEQAQQFTGSLPEYRDGIQQRITSLNERYEQLQLSPEMQNLINERISASINILSDRLTASAGSAAIDTFAYLPWLLLIPVLAFLFLKDAALYRSMLLRCFPSGSYRARAESIVNDLNRTLASFTRAQLLSVLLIGVICTIAFSLIGLDYALLLGIFAGVLEFIPLLGPLLIGITATSVGLFSANPWNGLYVAVFLLALRLVHDYVTYPWIVRDGLRIHPMAVILSILAGEQIAGAPGVFLSIPVVAVLTVFYRNFLEHSGRESLFADLFGKEDGSEETPDAEENKQPE